ncbi:hypothetical protein CsatB_026389 [Cannabis sativa]
MTASNIHGIREESNVSLKKLKGMLFEGVKYFKKLKEIFLVEIIPFIIAGDPDLETMGKALKVLD